MFQRKAWASAVVQSEGRNLKITVSPPGSVSDAVFLVAIALLLFYGLVYLLFVPPPRIASPGDLWKLLPAVFFGMVFVFVFRGNFERLFATQIVTANAGGIIWARRSKLWARTRRLNAGEIADIRGSAQWTGFGKVYVTTKWRRHIVLDQLLAEDAVRLARKLKQAVGERT
jgi:hypothetical protein